MKPAMDLAMNSTTTKVWDPVVRVGHWLLAAAFFTAYLTEGEIMPAHVLAGYTIGTIVMVRIAWGFAGTAHARFSDFVRGPQTTAAYLRDLAGGRARRYLGHNPAGGAMIVLMFAMLLGTVATGLVLYAVTDGAGPLAGLLGDAALDEDSWEEVHEFFANTSLLLIGLHVGGVILSSVAHRENLVKAMFTGRKRAAGA